jgi:hypothetical protein
MLAPLLTHTKTDGGSIVNDVTEDAVIAYRLPDWSFVEITLTEEAKNLIAIINCSLDIDVIIYTQ